MASSDLKFSETDRQPDQMRLDSLKLSEEFGQSPVSKGICRESEAKT